MDISLALAGSQNGVAPDFQVRDEKMQRAKNLGFYGTQS